jgi:hypothetical protein
VLAFRMIEADTVKGGRGLDADGGVTISDFEAVPPNPSTLPAGQVPGKYSKPTRYYFARLHESPWSEANLNAAATTPEDVPPATPGPAPEPSPARTEAAA